MRQRLYRLYVRTIQGSVALRQWAYVQALQRRKARLHGADLSYLYLVGINLRDANLQEADLRACDLRGADLTGANLLNANLRGANLAGAKVDLLQLRMADTLQGAILPDGTRYRDHQAAR